MSNKRWGAKRDIAEPDIVKALEKAGYRIETDLGGNGYHGEPATGRGQLVVYGLSP